MNAKTFKVPADQRLALVQLYMESGMKGVEPMCRELGITAKYVANLASVMGLHRRKDNPGRSLQTENDPRWARARAVGVVEA